MNKDNIYADRTSTDDFLLYKAHFDKIGEDLEDILTSGDMTKRFAEILSGKPFLKAGLKVFKNSDVLTALAVKIHGNGPDLEKQVKITADILEKTVVEKKGVYNLIRHDLFGCLIPEVDEEEGAAVAEEILKAHGGDVVATIGLSRHPLLDFTRESLLDNARKALNHALLTKPGTAQAFNAVTLNIWGDLLYKKGHADDADHAFRTALRLDPDNINVLNSLGIISAIKGNYGESLKQFETAGKLAPEDVTSFYNTGLVHLLKGDTEKALTHFHDAETIDAGVFELMFQIGRLYVKRGDFEKGAKYIEKAGRLNPLSGPVNRYLGVIAEHNDKIDEAVTAYEKAVRINPNDAASLSSLGVLYAKQDENPEIAMVFLNQSVKLAPGNGLYHYRLGCVAYGRHYLEEALDAFFLADKLGVDSTEYIQKIEKDIDNLTVEDDKNNFSRTGS